MTRRRLIILLAFGVPGLALLGIIGFVLWVGPPELRGGGKKTTATPQTTWMGATRAPMDCPESALRGAELFDEALLRDQTTIREEDTYREVHQVSRQRIAVRKVSFGSYEMRDCELESIRVHGLLAMPVGAEINKSGRLAGVVRMHGLLPHEELRDAVELSARLKAAVLAVYSPGFRPSEGWDSRPDHFFDAKTDPRRSWLWSSSVALMRGLTFLQMRPEVNDEKLAVVGYSAGGMAALIAAGVDDRVKATVAWSATGYLDVAVQARPVPAWWVALLEGMSPPRTPSAPEWGALVDRLDPKNFLAGARSPVLLINGTQDQYFPLSATSATYDALSVGSEQHRLYLVTGYDHGPIADRVIKSVRPKVVSDVIFWIGHHLNLGVGYRERVPVPKVADVQPVECCPESGCRVCTQVQVELPPVSQYRVDEVLVHVSTDNARTFLTRSGKAEGPSTHAATLEFLTPEELERATYFAEVVYRPLGKVRRIRMSSRPHLPDGFVPRIWPDARLH